jgi:hypothetical protein
VAARSPNQSGNPAHWFCSVDAFLHLVMWKLSTNALRGRVRLLGKRIVRLNCQRGGGDPEEQRWITGVSGTSKRGA